MTKEEYLNLKVDAINSIESGDIKKPTNIPVDLYIQEAEDLHYWCQADRDALVAAGMDWALVEDLPVRGGALSAAEAIWINERFKKEEAQRQWNQVYPAAYKLRNNLVHHFRFAFRKDESLYGRVKEIADGNGHADMIQDLIILSILGKKNPGLLMGINFDMSLLDQASEMSARLTTLWAMATGKKMEYNESKRLRDKAYTYLKEAVDEIRKVGKYVFWKDSERLKGYRSAYYWRSYNKAKSKASAAAANMPERKAA